MGYFRFQQKTYTSKTGSCGVAGYRTKQLVSTFVPGAYDWVQHLGIYIQRRRMP